MHASASDLGPVPCQLQLPHFLHFLQLLQVVTTAGPHTMHTAAVVLYVQLRARVIVLTPQAEKGCCCRLLDVYLCATT
jgi:hypothetical protein